MRLYLRNEYDKKTVLKVFNEVGTIFVKCAPSSIKGMWNVNIVIEDKEKDIEEGNKYYSCSLLRDLWNYDDLIKYNVEDVAYYFLCHELTRQMNLRSEYIVLDLEKLIIKFEDYIKDMKRKK